MTRAPAFNMFWAMSARPQVAIVVVSYNTKKLLLECLASAAVSAGGANVELVVVDNASTDGSFEAAREHFPQALMIRNESNRGFGAACNQAIKATSAPFILLLNSDARLTPGAFSALYDSIKSNDACGAAGCRLVNAQGEETVNARNFLTPLNQAIELLGLAGRFRTRWLARTRNLRLDANLSDCAVDWIDGACLILRRAALDEVGLFDERFFMYSEDEDLCLRLKGGGWQVCYSARGTAIHHGGGSSAEAGLETLRRFYSSQMLFLSIRRGRASVALYKMAMKTALTLKRLAGGSAGRRDESTERLTAFRRACEGALDGFDDSGG
ncbi:MAG TPA: glycosyltransferase family 2 protein [Blastocatellia bacterium]|nr:glycosyltransferase family 2 protein [Blastocatellia bacterium]